MHYIALPVSQGKITDWQTFHDLLMRGDCADRLLPSTTEFFENNVVPWEPGE